MAELELHEKAGRLISAEAAQRSAFDSARRARDLLMSIPDRLAAVIAGESDVAKIEGILEEEIRRALDALGGHATPSRKARR
jgi:hypothetical protein